MDAETRQAFQGLNANIGNLTSLTRFLLVQVLNMANDVATLQQTLADIKTAVASVADTLATQGTSLQAIQDAVNTENQAIGTLTTDVTAVAALVNDLRHNTPDLPQSVFDTLGQISTSLANAAAAASASGSALSAVSGSIGSANTAIQGQADALAGIVTPPTSGAKSTPPSSAA